MTGRDRANLPGRHLRHRAGHAADERLDATADEIGDRGPRAFVRDVRELRAACRVEKCDRQMSETAEPGRAEVHLAGCVLASSISSLMLFAGTEGCTTKSC